MIYLILDTNVWLYLANGYDPISEKHHDDLHFNFLSSLKKLKDNGDIRILVNEIIFKEWERNRENSKLKIQNLSTKLKNPESAFSFIKKYVKSEIKKLQEEYIHGLKSAIEANRIHIQNVEDFLYKDCLKIEISEALKLKIFDLSINKSAPFHNKKNNIADAAILLSASEYLKGRLFNGESSAIFVSNNFTDFTDGINKSEFHPDIRELLTEEINYERLLPQALNLSTEIIKQIEEYNKYEYWFEKNTFVCDNPFCDGHDLMHQTGILSKQIKVIFEEGPSTDPNQLTLFPEIPQNQITDFITGMGYCSVCEELNIECPECFEISHVSHNNEFFCSHCYVRLEFKLRDTEKEYLYVHNGEETEANGL